MIHNIFILTKSGITLYYKAYTQKAFILNQIMVSAFFSAMFSFSNNLTGRSLELLSVGDCQFVIEESPDLLFISLIDKDDSIRDIKDRLKKIQDFFYKNFAKHIEKKLFDGDLERFNGIDPIVDDLLLKPSIFKKEGEFLKILEEIKKLVNTQKKGTKLKLNNFLDEVVNHYKAEPD